MATHAVHTAVIPSPDRAGLLAVTDIELIRACLDGRSDQPVGQIAREPMAAVAPEDSLKRAVALMARAEIAHVLVAERDAEWPSGVLSSFDVAAVLAGRDPALARMIRPAPARPLVSATRLSDTTVGQVMHPGLIACPPRHAAGRARGADGGPAGPLRGGVRGRPPARRRRAPHLGARERHGRGPRCAPRRACNSATAPVALPEDARLDRAAALMVDHDVAHVVAVGRTGLPSGVVSSLDVVRILAAG